MTKRIIIAAALILVMLTGCAKNNAAIKPIGTEAATKLAIEASGESASAVDVSGVTLQQRDGIDYYQVDFAANGKQYQYNIDALSGAVINSEQGAPLQGDSAASGVIVIETAKQKALQHAGLSAAQVTFLKSAMEYENGRQVYDIEFYSSDYTEYDYEIDALTGEVISYDNETEVRVPSNGESTISAEQAKEIALAQVPGATAADITDFETDNDDGRKEYEGTILYNNMEYEFEIDAYSGAIRSWEAEPAKNNKRR